MSDPAGTPAKVELVAWRGDVAQLAARLRIPERELTARLRALAIERPGTRLVVTVNPANSGPILAALSRRLNEETAA